MMWRRMKGEGEKMTHRWMKVFINHKGFNGFPFEDSHSNQGTRNTAMHELVELSFLES